MSRSINDIIKKDKGSKDRKPLSDLTYDTANEEIKFISTNSISLNLLYSGRVNGGIPIGHMSMISAPSQLGKSFIANNIIKNAQKMGMQIVVIDTERAFKRKLAETMGIDLNPDKLVHFRESRIEEIESVINTIVEELTIEERRNTLFVFDSWGTLITSKAVADSLKGNDVMDMTDPKKKNRLANVILNTQATFFVVNHVYDALGGFGDPLQIPGGRKIAFNCEAVVLGMSRSKDKSKAGADGEMLGHIIKAKTFKSRFSKVESKLEYRMKNEGGLDPYYGILDDAIEYGCVEKSKPGCYTRPVVEDDKDWKEKDIYCAEFWKDIFKHTDFADWLQMRYTFSDDNTAMKDEEFLGEIFA